MPCGTTCQTFSENDCFGKKNMIYCFSISLQRKNVAMKTIAQERYTLNPAAVDEISDRLMMILSKYEALTRRDVLRIRLTAEDLMVRWLERIEAATPPTITLNVEETGRSLDVTLEITGVNYSCDPMDSDEFSGVGSIDNIMATFGTGWVYQFDRGINSVYISVPIKKSNMLLNAGIAVFSAVFLAVALRLLWSTGAVWLENHIFVPLFDYFSNFLRMVVSPMMFVSVVGGVMSLGSPRILNKLGKIVSLRYLLATLKVIVLAGVVCVFCFDFDLSPEGLWSDVSFPNVLHSIIPDNIFSPFIEGNMIQIIFLAVIVGIAMLFLQRQIHVIGGVIDELNILICKILSGFEKILPFFIFLSVLNVGLSTDVQRILSFLRMALIFAAFLTAVTLVQLFVSSYKLKISAKVLWKKFAHPCQSALFSSSSSAAFAEAYDVCENTFGIDKKLVGFALPAATVIYKPMIAAEFVFFVVSASDYLGKPLTLSSLATLLLMAFILSVAYPPVSGGEVSCYTLLLAQMGLPTGLLAFACAQSALFDFIEIPANILSTYLNLLTCAKKMKRMDCDPEKFKQSQIKEKREKVH